jgi:primosomal protein N' (replication factor Y) (superfamily II helicase)
VKSSFVTVAVPVPFLNQLTYRIPDDDDPPVRGARVVVPLGTRLVTGIVTGLAVAHPQDEAGAPRIKTVIDTLDDEAFLPEAVLDLALWVAEYYACGVGDAISSTMPPRSAVQSERRVTITDRGRNWLAEAGGRRASINRSRVLEALASGRTVPAHALASKLESKCPSETVGLSSTLRSLEREGLVVISQPLRGRAAAHKTVRMAALTAQGRNAIENAVSPPLGTRQREALMVLSGSPEGFTLPVLEQRGVTGATLTRLGQRGLVAIRRERIERDPFVGLEGHLSSVSNEPNGRSPTIEQAAAVSRLTELAKSKQFRVALLRGVTGSGKTEVYLQLARAVQAQEQSVLVLVPEIALTPAVASVFRTSFGDRVAIQHSGLSDGERYDQWHRIRRGEISVVVGTRSAVFAPLPALGLIVVDEEHDASFKQEESPRYHGRDVAIMRAKRAGALVVLGSATPAVETYQHALNGRYERVTLERRVFDRPLASVRMVSMREAYAERGPDVIFSDPLKAAIEQRLARAEQSLVLLNRRGLATAVFCRQCASTVECPNCSVSLTVHTERHGAHRARCHYCNYSVRVPKTCPLCAGPYLERAGFGTERVEAEIKTLWPAARVARLDRDVARRRGAVPLLLAQVARGELDVLVGTQMIAKGHDFPRVTLVGVISADVGLGLADFRAAERTFQLLTQVAGRAGRGDVTGEAVIQTLYPDHYSIQHACRQDYNAFFQDEIRYRQAMGYPPFVGLVNAVVRAPTFAQALEEATDIASALRRHGDERYRVLGPAPAPIGRLRGEYRVQLFLKGTHRGTMRKALMSALAARKDVQKRVIVDVDPISVL